MAFCIITDSASDVPESVIKEYGLHVIPTPVTIEGKDYFPTSSMKYRHPAGKYPPTM